MRRMGHLGLSSMGLMLAIGLLCSLRASVRGTGAERAVSGSVTGTGSLMDYVVVQVMLADVDDVVLSIAAGDLDQDGDIDLVSDGLFAWINPTTSTFSAPWVSATLAAGFHAQDIALGDLDRDGDLDIVAGGDFGLAIWQNPLTQSVSTPFGNGTPFGTWPISHVLTTSQPIQAVAAVDLDGDGWLDIAAARDDPVPPVSGDLCIWQNPGSITGTWASVVLTRTPGILTVAAGDLNGDGWSDLATGAAGMVAESQEIRIWQNDHTPFTDTWASAQVIDVSQDGQSSNVNSIALIDLDDDGWLDIVAGYQTGMAGTVGVWRNLGMPFTMPWALSVTMTGGARIWRVAAGDLDNDGSVDVISAAAFSSTGNEVTWWRNDGSPFDGAWSSTWKVGPWHNDLLLADLDGNDGPETVVTRMGSPEIVAYLALWEHIYLPVTTKD